MTGHIFIEGEIGQDAEVSVKTVRADIAQYPQAKNWIVHFNSGGGDVYEGYQIGNILKNLGNTTAHVGSSCASIATYAADCCDTVIMNPHGDWMIHLPTGSVQGNEHDFDRAADQLRRIKSELADRYMTKVSRKGVTREQVLSMIEKETSMSPSEALAMGFIDDVQEKMKAVAKLDLTKFQMENTLTKEQAEGMFATFGKKIDKLLKSFKNAVQIALADGTMASSDAPTPDALVGSTMTDENGAPLADGEHPTADGFNLTIVGGAGKVEKYEPVMADKTSEVDALKKQVADLTAQLAAKSTEAVQATTQATAQVEAKFKTEFKNLKDELEKLKSQTFGDTDAPDKATEFKAEGDGKQKNFDPMAELGNAWISSRDLTIFKNN